MHVHVHGADTANTAKAKVPTAGHEGSADEGSSADGGSSTIAARFASRVTVPSLGRDDDAG